MPTLMMKIDGDGRIITYPYTPYMLSQENPTVSFPSPLNVHDLMDFGVVEVLNSPKPSYSKATEKAVEVSPVITKGKYTRTWEVVTLPPEELADALLAKRGKQVVSRLQALGALLMTDQLDSMRTYVETNGTELQKLAFENASEWHRLSPALAGMWVNAGGTEEELDALFDLAENIEV